MKIAHMACFSYELPLTRPLRFRGDEITVRRGLLLRLASECGRVGWGEIAPLTGFSREDLSQARQQFRLICKMLTGAEVPAGLERFDGTFSQWLGAIKLFPSIRFGVETAILQMLAQERGVSLQRILSDEPRESVVVNALLAGSVDDVLDRARALKDSGYGVFKLKVGARPISEDIELVHRVRQVIGNEAGLRLDANRAYDLTEAVRMAEAVHGDDIEYIEEPVRTYFELLELTRTGTFPLPVALDESLLSISPRALIPLRGLKAVVLKPTLLGFAWAVWFARRAQQAGMITVVSSSFESSLGLTMLAALAAGLNGGASGPDVAVGLDTIDRLGEDLISPPLRIENGRIDLARLDTASFDVTHDSVEELIHD